MKLPDTIARSTFLIRLRSWEYWPFGIVQFPAFLYWLYLSFRARSLVFFSASNPGIPMGGMFGESKYQVLKSLPASIVPRTILVTVPVSAAEVLKQIAAAGLQFPLIFKPDIGERGHLVKRIDREEEISSYLQSVRGGFLVQELVSLPLEFGAFFMRMPGEDHGKVISLVAKEMLSVTGDGKATLRQLIDGNDRARLQWRKLRETFNDQLDSVIPRGETLELVSIGNHARGTKFLNANDLIDDRMSAAFSNISRQIPGFYFGRYDLRCGSTDDLYSGNVKILELNGCGAEPAHIYDPEFSFWEAWRVQIGHWEKIFRIATANRRRGARYISHREAWACYRKFRSVMK